MEISSKNEEMLDEIKKFTRIFEKIYFYTIFNVIKNKNEKKKNINNSLIKILDNINKKRISDENLFDKIIYLIDFMSFNNIENLKYFDIIKFLIKKKKFNNLNKNDLEKIMKKKEAIIYLNNDDYKRFINYITK
mgnify:CR=1 FL=1